MSPYLRGEIILNVKMGLNELSGVKHSGVYLFILQFLFCFGIVFGANINHLQLGTHSNYTLLVFTCDQDVTFNVNQNEALTFVEFPKGTGISISVSELARLRNEFVKRIRYDEAQARMVIEVKKNYELRVYRNCRPFQLVMDFAHLPGKPEESVARDTTYKPPLANEIPAVQEPQVEDGLPKEPYLRGLALKEKGEYEEALKEFQAAIPTRGKSARYQTALMYEELNQREAAIHKLVEVINIAPSWIEPRIKLGLLYQLSGRPKRAETVWYQILEVIKTDFDYDFGAMKEQISELESIINEDYANISDKAPAIDFDKFPKLPWKLILFIIGIAATVIMIRLITNWRMNRMISSVLDEEFDGEAAVEPMRETPRQTDELPAEMAEPVSKREPGSAEMSFDGGEDVVEDKAEGIPELEPAKSEDVLSDEKQLMIYELAKQDYSIAEISKMMNMGQEEVKFVLDFRSQSEDISK